MSKRTKIILIVLAVLIIGAVLYFLFRKPKALKETAAAPATEPDVQVIKNDDFPFTVGSRGENVKRLQMALNRIKPSGKILEDGVFGAETRSKLLTTVRTGLSALPMSEQQLLQIIRLGNDA